MKMMYVLGILVLCGFCSCVVTAPRYSTSDKVFTLKIGMTEDEVAAALGVSPYYLKSETDSETILLYKYRVTDRTTLPVFMGPTNGKSVLGKFVNLLVTYDSKGVSKKFETCTTCDETTIATHKLDVGAVITFLTITLPWIVLFLGFKTTVN
jgi:hypothetical protein